VTVHTLQMNMSRGALGPLMHARVDTDHFQNGVKELDNWIVLRFGGLTRMPGSIHLGSAKFTDGFLRFLPFQFNRTQVYAIEAGHHYFRFWTLDGQVVTGGSTPYEIATPYGANDLDNIQFRQSGDVIYMTCRGYRPKQLTRRGETDWTLTDMVFKDGPYLKINETGTMLTPSTRNSLTPEMTIANAPSGTVTQSAGNGYLIFDGRKSNAMVKTGNTGWIAYRLPGATAKVVDSYWLAIDGSQQIQQAPVSWTLSGSNDGGVSYIVIDSRDRESGWAASETRFYEFFNKTAYNMYKFEWTGTDGAENASRIGELGLNEAGDTQTPWTITASSTTGINDNNGFVASDVGRMIRVQGSDRKWRWCRIVTRVNATTVTVRMYGHALPDYSPFANWRLGAWSDYEGWPRCIGMFEDRLVFAGTDDDPVAGWTTVNGAYDNFRQSDPIVSDDAASFRLTGGKLNEILWLHDDRFIVCGTAGSIRAVGRNDPNKQFGPDNIRQLSQTEVPASPTPPIAIGEMILFIDASTKRIHEMSYTYEGDRYIARELTALNEHLLEPGIGQFCFQSSPHKVLWGVRNDGAVMCSTYDRDQKVYGTGVGRFSGPQVTSVVDMLSLPGDGVDEVLAIVYRYQNPQETVSIERLAPFYNGATAGARNPIYAHEAFSYTGPPTTEYAVPHLAGRNVGVWADGVDIGDLPVDGAGKIVFPFPVSRFVVGFRKLAHGRTLRVPEYGQRDGTGLGRRINVKSTKIDLFETPFLTLGVGDDGPRDELAVENDVDLDPLAPKPLHTGMFPITVEGGWNTGGELVFETDRMYPATIRAISLAVDGEP